MRSRQTKTELINIYLINGDCRFKPFLQLLDKARKHIEKDCNRNSISYLPRDLSKLNMIKAIKDATEKARQGLT